MSAEHPKKLLILYILDILQKYSDEEHRLSQKDIQDILKKEYEMPVDRKAVKRNLLNLIEYGSNIEYREVARPKIDRDMYQIDDDEQFCLELLKQEKVMLVPGKGFNWNEPDHFRIVYLPRVEELAEVQEKLTRVLNQYRR